MLTPFQLSRIKFHLGYPQEQTQPAILEVLENLVLDNLSPETELTLVGPKPPTTPYVYLGEVIGDTGSLLVQVEQAYQKLAPTSIDDSLFVKQAGSVTLRPDEYRARKQLYEGLKSDLAVVVDVRLYRSGSPGPSLGAY